MELRFYKKFLYSLIILSFNSFVHANQCVDELASHVTKDGDYNRVDLSHCYLQNKDIPAIINFLELLPANSLEFLDLSYNSFTDRIDPGVFNLLIFLRASHLLGSYGEIRLNNNHIAEMCTSVFYVIPELHKLDVSSTDIRSTYDLARGTALQELNLANNFIDDFDAKILASNNSLISLNLSQNAIGDAGAAAFANNSALKYLNLGRNQIHDQGAQALALNSSIENLVLDANFINYSGAAALSKNKHLHQLDLSFNNIGDLGALFLASSNSIQNLTLRFNSITNVGVKSLAADTYLVNLDVGFNTAITDEGAIILARKTFASLAVDSCNIGIDGITALKNAVKQGNISVLYDSGNPGNV